MGAWLAPVSLVLTHASASLRRLDREAGISTTPRELGQFFATAMYQHLNLVMDYLKGTTPHDGLDSIYAERI